MKVLLVVTGLPSKTEPARSVFNLIYAKELIAQQHEVVILYLRGVARQRSLFRRSIVDGVQCIEVSALMPFNLLGNRLFLLPLILRFLLDPVSRKELQKCDIIHGISGGSLELAYELSKKFGKKFVAQFIGTDVNVHLQNSLKRRTFRAALNECSFLCFESNALLATFKKQVQVNVPHSVYYRGIKLADFDYVLEKKKEVTILFLGGFRNDDENLKGGITLLNSINKLKPDAIDTDVSIKIGGPNSKSYAGRIGEDVPKRVKVSFIGAVDREMVKLELQRSHIVIIPSLFEGLPNMLFESMSSGNLVIASRVGGMPEVIDNGENGILFAPGDEEMLANVITQSLDMEKIEKFAIKARATVGSYLYDNYIRNYIKLYNAVLN